MKKTHTVFVYGTLMRGYAANQKYLSSAEFLGEGTVTGNLVHLPFGYPCILPGNGTVYGELYEVSHEVFLELRKYEGTHAINPLYRELQTIVATEFGTRTATVFVTNPVKERAVQMIGTRVPHGDWNVFMHNYRKNRPASLLKSAFGSVVITFSVF